jgi:hypothetical protein
VIAVNDIVAVHALKMPGQYHSSVPPENINQAERNALIMQHANGVFVNV